jgi:hypothetical protein
MTPSDLDAILAQLAEGHWPRPTAALGRAIVERIRDAEVERDELRRSGDLMTRAIWRLLVSMESGSRAAQIDAYVDAQQPFQRWREVLYGTPAPAAGEGGTG